MNDIATEPYALTMLSTDPAVDLDGRAIAVGDTVIVRPQEGSRSRQPWCEWLGEVTDVHCVQPVEGGKRIMVQPPRGSQWASQPVMVRAGIVIVIAHNGESN